MALKNGDNAYVDAFLQDLYGDDLVTAMTNRVNFTVNHFRQQVKIP